MTQKLEGREGWIPSNFYELMMISLTYCNYNMKEKIWFEPSVVHHFQCLALHFTHYTVHTGTH